MKFEIGSIAFQGRKGNIYSDVIKSVTKSKFSHTFIFLGEFHGRQAILEAGSRETVINFLDQYLNPEDYWEVYSPYNKNHISPAIEKCLKEYLHVAYSYPQAIGVGLVSLNRSLGIKLNNPFPQGIICSELAYYYIQQVLQLDSIAKLDSPNNVSPEDVHAWISTSGYFSKTYAYNM